MTTLHTAAEPLLQYNWSHTENPKWPLGNDLASQQSVSQGVERWAVWHLKSTEAVSSKCYSRLMRVWIG